jgi:hypothetical protein
MARSLFNFSTLRQKSGFAGRYRAVFEEDEWPPARYVDSTPRSRFKWPWIYKFIGYHLMAALGIVLGFVAWLIVGAINS